MLLDFFGRMGNAVKRAFKHFKTTKYFRPAAMACAAILAVVMFIGLFNLLTRPNALEVYVNDQQIGIVRQEGRHIDGDYILRHATARLRGQLDTEIQFADEIIANPARIGSSVVAVTFDNLITELINVLDYYIYAGIITVDGVEMAALSSAYNAQGVLDDVAYHLGQDPDIDHSFAEEVTITRRYIHHSGLDTHQYAMDTLTTYRNVYETHTVRQGDNLSLIAYRAGMTLAALLANNPNVNPDTILREGDRLHIIRSVPALSLANEE
ncbi:MAG: LysM peptidoglycan-binding domain-containing protein [Defluviitaleaceae bacterium]|nr:LysM peptidoglycan-binding domain-containing protein [Defluviitaleaceae bacterium]